MHQGSLVFMLNNEFQLAKSPLLLCEIIPVIKGFLSFETVKQKRV